QTNTPDAPRATELPQADAARQLDAAAEFQKKLQPLMEKRLAAVKEQMVARAEELAVGRTSVDVLLESSRNLLKTQPEMSEKPVDLLRMLETHFQRMKVVQEMLERRFQAGKGSIPEAAQARYNRYDAEIALERFKAKLGNQTPAGEVTKALFEGTAFNDLID